MLTTTIIAAKRDGKTLDGETIAILIRRFVSGEVTDEQMAAFAMAVCIRGMDANETAALTDAMLHSGGRLPRCGDQPRLDKHSTGGLGDKVSLLLAPIIAAMGYHVPMISGRGLGITGGTLDKLESIPGFRTDLSVDQIGRVLDQCGCVITGATDDLAPADRRLYAIRDVTATVPSVPLITASILSKKLSASLGGLVMDVKCGNGAFMNNPRDAAALSESLCSVAKINGLPVASLISDMDQPLGYAVGNAIEVAESTEILSRQCSGALSGNALSGSALSGRVETLTIELVASVVSAAGLADHNDAAARAKRCLDDGTAMERFQQMVAAQGGGPIGIGTAGVDLAAATEWCSRRDGWVESIDCQTLGEVVIELGGGRRRQSDRIDHRVGLSIGVQIGDAVERGQPILTVYTDSPVSPSMHDRLHDAITIGPNAVSPPALFQRVTPVSPERTGL